MFHGGAIDPERLTYARIAEIAGVSERTVYRFFPQARRRPPIGLGHDEPTTLDGYAAMIEEITRTWSERMGHVRIAEHEVGAEDYPHSFEARRDRDRAFIDHLAAVTANAPRSMIDSLPSAAVHRR